MTTQTIIMKGNKIDFGKVLSLKNCDHSNAPINTNIAVKMQNPLEDSVKSKVMKTGIKTIAVKILCFSILTLFLLVVRSLNQIDVRISHKNLKLFQIHRP